MGVRIRDTILTCDYKGCKENAFTNATTKTEMEALGWGIAARNPYTDEWKAYCQEHVWILRLLRNIIIESQIIKPNA